MNFSYTMLLVILISVDAYLIVGDINKSEVKILAAVKDSGCSTHPHKVIEQKQIKDTYNYDSLRSEG